MTTQLNSAIVRAALLLFFALSGGCATLFRGGSQKVLVQTDPTGATLIVDGKTYTTPTTVTVKRKKTYDVILKKDGYQGVHFELHPHWDAGGAGAVAMDAIVPGGSVLFIVDTIAGADRQFNKIATIKLPATTVPTTQLVTLYEHKGVLMNKEDYDAAELADGLFGKKTKKGTTTQATTQPSH